MFLHGALVDLALTNTPLLLEEEPDSQQSSKGRPRMKHLEVQRGYLDLVSGIRHYQLGNLEAASANWRRHSQPRAQVLSLFAQSLLANVPSQQAETSTSTNLYDSVLPPGDARQIDLFAEIGKLPYIHWAQRLAASAHGALKTEGTTHIDLGIGSGDFAKSLLQGREASIRRVIGVDLDPASVEQSRKVFRKMGIDFVGISESFDKLDWNQIGLLAGDGPVTINAAFALHHLPLAGKGRALDAIATLKPELVTLVEPSSAHWSADLLTRFVNAFAHFNVVGDLIDERIACPDTRAALLQFFGREITDIMRDSPDRFERHEQWQFWYSEMLKRNLLPRAVDPLTTQQAQQETDVDIPGPGVTNLASGQVHLLSVLAFGAARN